MDPPVQPTRDEATSIGEPAAGDPTLATPSGEMATGFVLLAEDPRLRRAPAALRSILDFLTDGSIPALLDELSRLCEAAVWLRDADGRAVIPNRERGKLIENAPAWLVVSDEEARRRVHELVGLEPGSIAAEVEAPISISTGTIGWIVACLPGKATSRDATLTRAVELLANSVCDVCEAQVSLRRRVAELDAMYRLSSALTQASDPETVLRLGLDLAIEVLGVDAGSVATLDDTGHGLEIKASRGVSPDWLSATAPISVGGQIRASALRGEVVSVYDMQQDERISDAAGQKVRAEGLRSLLATGLIDHGRAVGLIRLYTRTPRVFTDVDAALLKSIAGSAAAAVMTARLRQLRAADERMQRQVKLAGAVQRRMLPRSPSVPPFDVAAHYAPSFELGGDFYDFLELGGHLGILIGDVVGKGLPAALLMSSVRASLRAHAQNLYDIEQVLSAVNRALVRDTLDNEFATAWYGVADPQTLRLTYCGAGHDWPLLVRVPFGRAVTESDVQRLTADGMALGIDEHQRYPKGMALLEPRDVLVAYTDGLHDAKSFDGQRFGGTRLRRCLVELLSAEPEASAARIVDYIMAQLRQFAGLSLRDDDVTVVVVRVGQNGGGLHGDSAL